MNKIKDPTNVAKQYSNDANLKIRINLHKKYSTNKEGFGNWTFRNMSDLSNKDILEIGCGTGALWSGRSEDIEKANSIMFSDISHGMIESAKLNIGDYSNVEYKQFNAENIPFNNNHFDSVIANHMLYHVPDLNRVLTEIKRVLVPGGKLFATTFGENGIMKFINSILGIDCNSSLIKSSFTLQNGLELLKEYFNNVSCIEYKDSLKVTNEDDLVDYIFSMSSLMDSNVNSRPELLGKLKEIKNSNSGIIKIPKEACMFIATR